MSENEPTYDSKNDSIPEVSATATEPRDKEGDSEEKSTTLQPLSHSHTLSSVLSGTSIGHNYAVLPHGTLLEDWSEEDKAELNDYVRHLLHSRRAKFKRTMRAFGKFVRKRKFCLTTSSIRLLTKFSDGVSHNALGISSHFLGRCVGNFPYRYVTDDLALWTHTYSVCRVDIRR